MITITINGQELNLEKPVTILDAANMLGIKIPTFCNYPGLDKHGGCRMCLVEVEKMPRLQTSCTVYVADGMVIRTESEGISKARKAMLEFVLINHPLDCPWCDKAGECELQDLTVQYGAVSGRFKEGKRKHPESIEDPLIVRNPERCILCTRCVRMCNDVQGAAAITVMDRGGHSVVEPFSGGIFNCEYCGNCITVCPVGSLMSRPHRHAYRPWQMEQEVKSVCAFCGVGCSMILQARANKIIRTLPKMGVGINNGILCAKGRFGYDYIGSNDRLNTPLIRKNNRLEPATWEEALNVVAEKLKEIKSKFGNMAIGGIASARCTNEENYVFQKFFRKCIGNNNIDSISRATGFAVAQEYIECVLGPGATANSIADIKEADAVITIGGDPAHINPVLGVQVRGAYRKGSKVVTIGYAPGLDRFRTHRISPYPFTEGTFLSAMLSELAGKKEFSGINAEFETKIKEFVHTQQPDIEGICGISKDTLLNLLRDISGVSSIVLIIGPDIIQRTDTRTNLFLLSAIAYLINAKIYLLSEKPNEQGVIDAGCVPDKLPGAVSLEDEQFREHVGKILGCVIPSTPGLTLFDMIDAVNSGSIRAMYIMGENPAFNLHDSSFVKESLGKLEFLIVQDILTTETARMADVVLPSMGWAEKKGTYTNLERRVQLLGRAIKREGMEDWEIVSEIAEKMGVEFLHETPEDILAELAMVSPLHAGINYKDLEKGIDKWPPKEMPAVSVSRGVCWPMAPLWTPSDKNRVYLGIDKHMFHSGTISRRSASLNSIYKTPYVKISPALASRTGLVDGDSAIIKSERGQLILPVKIDRDMPDCLVLLTNYFIEKGAMGLVTLRIDHITKTPCINGIEIRIERAEPRKGA